MIYYCFYTYHISLDLNYNMNFGQESNILILNWIFKLPFNLLESLWETEWVRDTIEKTISLSIKMLYRRISEDIRKISINSRELSRNEVATIHHFEIKKAETTLLSSSNYPLFRLEVCLIQIYSERTYVCFSLSQRCMTSLTRSLRCEPCSAFKEGTLLISISFSAIGASQTRRSTSGSNLSDFVSIMKLYFLHTVGL